MNIFQKEACSLSIGIANKLSYKLDIKIKNSDLIIGVLFDEKLMYEHLKERYQYIKFEIEKLPDINLYINDSGLFYSHIYSHLKEALEENIKESPNSSAYVKTSTNIFAISQNIDQKMKCSNCHEKIFVPWCNLSHIIEDDLKEWFVDFSYKLRNILFHQIIDPFDERWSTLVKYCAQGLREFLLENIRLLEECESTQKRENN